MPEFYGKKVTNSRVLEKGGAAKWRSLTLNQTQVTDDGVLQLCAVAKDLEEIHIASGLISDTAMPVLCALPNLRSLILDEVPRVTDQGILHVASVLNLRELYLNGTQLTDTGIDAVLKCKELWSLSLARTQITDSGVSRLGSLVGLNIIRLDGTNIDGSGLSGLPNGERLNLYVADCPITNQGLMEFLEGHDRVERLSLNNTQISDDLIPAIARLPALVDLRLEGTAVTDAGVKHLLGHPTLGMLYLEGTAVSDEMIEQLKAESPKRLIVYR